ncbi:MAG TPA: Rv2175c family DNA-binding protein [Mycobacteriales bacterium]|nr:Rv2175c family DNA-binding protein [Mycobacteriales bacterium]
MTDGIDLLTVPEVAERLGLPSKRVQQLLREHGLAATTGDDGSRAIPADFLLPSEDGVVIVKGLSGVLTLLSDAGYSDEESIGWLFTADESLPGTPMEAMRAGRGTEVKRRAQALGF